MTAVVAYVTCSRIPDLEPDDLLTVEPLAALDIKVEPAIWDDPDVDWNRYDLAILRSTWDYTPRRDEFVAWAHTVPRLANDAVTVGWNTDKRYLAELAAAGTSVVPTTWIEPGGTWSAPTTGEWVVKPSISAGSRDTGRYVAADPAQREQAQAHVVRLTDAGRVVMVQPYLPAVDTHGETAMIFIGGVFSHAIRKGPLLTGPDRGLGERLYVAEAITPREPSAAEHALAAEVLSSLPAFVTPSLYARVDLVPGENGRPLLIELELTEPSLFFEHSPRSPARFAAAVANMVDL